jgi:biotin transport system substrate-specific component
MESRTQELGHAVLACLFAALISIGAYIAIPLPGTPIPIVLQNMFIMLAAVALGPWWSLLSVIIYLLFGFVGMPVFSGGTGGIDKLFGPTGGYLIGYIPATIAIGFISKSGKKKLFSRVAACIVGMGIVYIIGVSRLKTLLDIPWNRALASGLYPFIAGDLIKIGLTAALSPRIIDGIDSLGLRTKNA